MIYMIYIYIYIYINDIYDIYIYTYTQYIPKSGSHEPVSLSGILSCLRDFVAA